jgi:ATP-dependent DNA helicase RecG
MNSATLNQQLDTLIGMTHETMTVEFKSNLKDAKEIGAYISSLANSACLAGHEHAWLIWGVDDTSHAIQDTHFDPFKQKVGNQGLIMWLQQKTTPRADFEFHRLERAEGTVILLEIRPPRSAPIAFDGIRYIRIDSHKTKLSEHPDKESRIWEQLGIKNDWTGEIVPDATLEDLDKAAIRVSSYLVKSRRPPVDKPPTSSKKALIMNIIAIYC